MSDCPPPPPHSVLFWTDQSAIRMKTLSGVDLGVCHHPDSEALSLAVDVQSRHLFWLSSYSSLGEILTVSQIEYDSQGCRTERYVCVMCVFERVWGISHEVSLVARLS